MSRAKTHNLIGTLWIDLKTLANRWDCSRRTAARVARLNKIRAMKFGSGRNASVKFCFEDILRYEFGGKIF